jgi:ATP-dependent Clp protease ATP-binding subunit ClpB
VVIFKPLGLKELTQVVSQQLELVRGRLKDRGVALEVDGAVYQLIAEQAYDPAYGARPLKRYIQREIETKVARELISGEVVQGSTIRLTVVGGKVAVEHSGSADSSNS